MLRTGFLAVLFLCSCEPATDDLGVSRGELVGGQDDTTAQYAAVYYVRSEWNAMVPTHCSATLIAPRVLLLAGHCVDPRKAGSTSVNLFAQNVSPGPAFPSPEWVPLSAPVFHPNYNPADFRDPFDIALAMLPDASTAVPFPYNTASLDAGFVGAPLTAVGWGITSPSAMDHGTRRWVDLTFRAVTSTHLKLGDLATKGICNGDSGGPSLHRFADGVTRVVGVHSYTEPTANCLDGADVRVDRFGAFIAQYLADRVGPGCAEDGLCATGCATLDPDCVPVFGACTDDGQCDGRQCRTDPQRPERYCAPPCPCAMGTCVQGACFKPQLPVVAAGQPCTPGEMFCLDGTTCTGASAALARCARSCPCGSGERCFIGFDQAMYCETIGLGPVRLGLLGSVEAPVAKSGCAAAPGGLLLLPLALWLRRSRRYAARCRETRPPPR